MSEGRTRWDATRRGGAIAVLLLLLAVMVGGILYGAIRIYDAPSASSQPEPAVTRTLPTPETEGWRDPSHPPRSAVTSVRVSSAAGNKKQEEDDGLPIEVEGTVSVAIRLSADDPVIEQVRAGLVDLDLLEDNALGVFGLQAVGGSFQYEDATAPVLRFNEGQSTATVALTQDFSGTVYEYDTLLVEYDAPLVGGSGRPGTRRPRPPLDSHLIEITAGGWTVAGVTGQVPATQGDRSVELRGGANARVALVRDGYAPDVSAQLADVDHEAKDNEDEPGAEGSFPSLAGSLSTVAAIAIVFFSFVRALGLKWWRRRSNQILIVTAIGVLAVVTFVGLFASPRYFLLSEVTDILSAPYSALYLQMWPQLNVGGLIVSLASAVLLLPAVAVAHALHRLGVPPWRAREVWWLGAVLLATGTALIALGANAQDVRHLAPVLLLLLAGSGGAVVLARRLRRRWVDGRAMILVAFAVPVFLLGLTVLERDIAVGGGMEVPALVMSLALLWSPAAVAGVAVANHRWSAWHAALCVAGTLVVLAFPTIADLEDIDPDLTPDNVRSVVFSFAVQSLGLAFLLAFLLMVVRMFRLGRSPSAVTGQIPFATTVCCVTMLFMRGAGQEIPALLACAAVVWLLPKGAGRHLKTLSAVTGKEHKRLVRAALRLRVLRLSQEDFFRTMRARLAGGEVTVGELDRQADDLDQAVSARPEGIDPDLAFSTSGGYSPKQNGLAALLLAVLLALPLPVAIKRQDINLSLIALFDNRLILGLLAFGIVYGYFYPRVRGRSPITKGLFLAMAVLPPDIAPSWSFLVGDKASFLERLNVVAIVLGDVALLGLGLGVLWEWRFMRAAGESWARIRNIRNLRSLAAPLTAIAIAAGTAAATSLAGAAVTEIVRPAPSPSAGTATSSPGIFAPPNEPRREE
ncbi:hypothetical protein [Microbispora rosea]|uniref:hypothetical protein n=1 Tax=Microbispora rosea TaxID=58117 RepID=UPI0004C391D8|nr:hypothetical protein [Microbispora rosea]